MNSSRLLPVLLAILAWCCLASPWQSCLSDCREGALQPMGHGCHPKAEVTHSCHCPHDLADAPSAGDRAAAIDAAGFGGLGHRCEGAHHLSVVFPQREPEPGPVLVDLPGEPQPFTATIAELRGERIQGICSAVDPPGPEPQWLRQLRAAVLLL